MGLNDPETEIDLAVADFQRDTSSGSSPDHSRASAGDEEKKPVYLGESLELLTKVLKDPRLTPDQWATATFDLAMVYQQMQLWDEAVLTWEKYLQLDTAGAWHDDAWRSLEEAKKKIPPPKPQGYRSSSFFLQHSSDPTVLARLEEYVEIALREWLPEIDNKDGYESLAFGKLAQLMRDQHGDPWVRDFLLARRARDGPALIALSKAVSNNKIGWYTEARHQAQEAENLFAAVQHRPGQLRARFEAVYADQRLLQQKNCLKNAQALDESLLHTQYQWLRAQTAMGLAACLNFANRTQTAQGQITKAGQIAIAANFPILNLRVQGWNAGIHIWGGDCAKTWEKTEVGLAQYWQGPASPLLLHDFYSYLKLCLAKKKLWHAAESLERRMITILEKEIDRKDENVALEVTAHRSLEQILKELDEPEEAANEAMLSLQLLAQVEPKVAVSYSIPIKFDLADLQLERNDAEAAWATIREVEEEVRRTGNDLLFLTFLRIRGDANFRKQLLFEAEVDYKQGIEIAESAILRNQTEEQRRNRMEETGDLYRGLVRVYIQQNRGQEALQLWEWYQTRSFAMGDKLMDAKGPPKWSDIERSVLNQPLPAGATPRLVYVSTRDKLLVWTFGVSGTKTAELPVKREELQRRIREYVGKIGREQRESFPSPAPEVESKELFALVLQPVLADLSRNDPAANPVVVDFDPAMSGLPVEALMSSEGWYFGQRFPVIYSPGYVRENALRKYSQQVPGPGLAIDALGNQGTVARFKELVPPAVIIDDQDGRPAERESLLAQSEVFLFAGHGKSGALLLGNSKPLKAEDFPQQSLANMQLAVLVACSSGVAREGLLDTGSLVHAFQNGGTPVVVASQWNVAADFTEQFMDRFFSNMKKGDSPAQALFEARKQLFRVKSHPYYWAAFTVSGRP
jgi:CHAT domain-containing protein